MVLTATLLLNLHQMGETNIEWNMGIALSEILLKRTVVLEFFKCLARKKKHDLIYFRVCVFFLIIYKASFCPILDLHVVSFNFAKGLVVFRSVFVCVCGVVCFLYKPIWSMIDGIKIWISLQMSNYCQYFIRIFQL